MTEPPKILARRVKQAIGELHTRSRSTKRTATLVLATQGIPAITAPASNRDSRLFLHLEGVNDALHAGRIPCDFDRLLTGIQRLHRSAQVNCATAGYHLNARQIHFLIRKESIPDCLRQRFVLRSFGSRDLDGSFASHHLTTQNKREN